MKTAFYYHDDCVLHDMGGEHPEAPGRITAILNGLRQSGLMDELDVHLAEEASLDHLLSVHPKSYVDQLKLLMPEEGIMMVDADTILMPDTLRAALLGAGSGVQAVDLVMSGMVENAFCAIRPPGHHAERARSMGFCLFNNIAIAARRALSFHHLERVAIIDFDVHQANGTVDIFQDDPRVMVCSSFEHPLYPYSHYDIQREHVINVPLDAHSDGSTYRRRTEAAWLQRLQDFKPQLVLISAGFDAHKADPLASLELEEADYRWLTQMLMDVADIRGVGRVVSMLEGGYNQKALASSVHTHIETLAGH